MESEENYQKALADRKQFNAMKNRFCKNAIFNRSRTNDEGCANMRRAGSAFCQQCSDKYKELSHA